jgi:hypothetical protein
MGVTLDLHIEGCLTRGRFGGNWGFDVVTERSRKLRPENEVFVIEVTTAYKLNWIIVFALWRYL